MLFLLFSALCLATPAWFAESRGQQQQADKEPGKKDGRTRLYYGVKECKRCHTQPLDQDPVLCRCREVPIWEKQDKHKEAWNVLQRERAKRMGELLHIIDVAKAPECVGCHGVYVEDKKLRHSSFKEEEAGKEGVTCVACHGAYEDWIDSHGGTKREKWRTYSRELKEKKYGMKDLWDPAKRAHLCASCHVGNAESGWQVTHAMYAAGHPPLPGIEIAAFSDKMPRHWQYLREKTPEVQKMLGVTDDADFERTKLVLVGAMVALNDAARLVAREANTCAEAKDPNKQALDLAHFDCYACHHDLKSPSWRQQRGYLGKPGRPQMRPWAVTLARLGVRAAGERDKGLDDRLAKVYAAFDARPFGDCKAVATAAQGLSEWLTPLAADLVKKKMDRAAARQLLADLCAVAQKESPDYDSARQIAWAFEVIYKEAVGEPTKDVRAALDGLNTELKTDIPSTQQRDILKELPQGLAKISSYDPQRFKALMAKLSEALRAK